LTNISTTAAETTLCSVLRGKTAFVFTDLLPAALAAFARTKYPIIPTQGSKNGTKASRCIDGTMERTDSMNGGHSAKDCRRLSSLSVILFYDSS